MARVITLARNFMQGHPKAGRPTYFVERALASMGYPVSDEIKPFADLLIYHGILHKGGEKRHTIRFGRRWKDGDMASLRVWSGKPYNSKQIAIAPDVRLRVVNIIVDYKIGFIYKEFNGSGFKTLDPNILAINDGLTFEDFSEWFEFKKHKGKNIAKEAQILIWGDVKEY